MSRAAIPLLLLPSLLARLPTRAASAEDGLDEKRLKEVHVLCDRSKFRKLGVKLENLAAKVADGDSVATVAQVKVGRGKTLAWVEEMLEPEVCRRLIQSAAKLDDVTLSEMRAAVKRPRGGSLRTLELPKGMTADEVYVTASWWGSATLPQRQERLLLLFVVHGDVFERHEGTVRKACEGCSGTGLQSKTLRTGSELTFPGKTCRGKGADPRSASASTARVNDDSPGKVSG